MEPPDEFVFPFPAYSIQQNFMRSLYRCLENSGLGIFESPTGTGKSLSIICGALKWLLDHEESQKNELCKKIAELDAKLKEMSAEAAGDWFTVQTGQLELSGERQRLQSRLDLILKNEEKLRGQKEELRKRWKKRQRSESKKTGTTEKTKPDSITENGEREDDDLILDDALSHSEGSDEEDEVEPYRGTKIYFCSRTHSQLSQFIGELKKSPYGSAVRLVPLASRLSYCVNENVRKLRHVGLMNERCLQLQRKRTTVKAEKDLKKSKTVTSCPFLPGAQASLLKAEILGEIQDVEEILEKGRELKTCAYYSSRSSATDGQIITVPYNSVLHKDTRSSLGIDMRGNVLIVDEAHNLLDAIERMHSAEISGRNILHCYGQLTRYRNRFESLFSARNLLTLNQLSFCLKKLMKVLGGTTKSSVDDKTPVPLESKLYSMEEFEMMAEIDTINLFKLLDSVKASKLAHKLQGYVEKYDDVKIHATAAESGVSAFLNKLQSGKESTNKEHEEPSTQKNSQSTEARSSGPILSLLSFLECLKSSCADGRISVNPGSTLGQGTIKFLLLNPASRFSDIVKDARAVVLAGGTMEPMSEFREQLFLSAGAKPERIVTFSCDHVVPKENILTSVMRRGPTGTELEFTFQNRESSKLLDELGRILSNICNIVPAGIVVFLPSYSYEAKVYKHLEVSGILKKMSLKKRIFREPKLASQVDKTLEQYADAVRSRGNTQNGALLFSVVGGKLSEGLNFSDDLGRCVMVVGMPYPNIKSPELQEKMKYLNENVAPGAGNVFYENACMKAVNQCIGRAVRHSADYSTVVLLDKRYTGKLDALPTWIRRSLTVSDSFGAAVGGMAKFFAGKRARNTRETEAHER